MWLCKKQQQKNNMIEGSIQGLLDRVYILTVHLFFMLLLEGK